MRDGGQQGQRGRRREVMGRGRTMRKMREEEKRRGEEEKRRRRGCKTRGKKKENERGRGRGRLFNVSGRCTHGVTGAHAEEKGEGKRVM
eukprot:626696-Rhodomonas_salina.1